MTKKRYSRKKKSSGKSQSGKKVRTPGSIDLRGLLPYLAVVVVLTFASLFPVIQADFTEIDDQRMIMERTTRLLDNPGRLWIMGMYSPHYKPLVQLSWVMEARLFGLDAGVLHFNNLLIHIFNTILVFFLSFKLAKIFDRTSKQPELIATATAVLWGVHPMHVESIAWAVERKDVLYAFFFLIGLLAYLRYVAAPGLKWMIAASVCFLASILCKAPAIVFPVMLFAVDYGLNRKFDRKLFIEKWLVYIIFIFGLIVYGVFGEGSGGGGGGTEGSIANMLSERPVTRVSPVSDFPGFYGKIVLFGLKGVFWYIHTIIPVGLSIAYPYKTWLPAIGHGIHVFPVILAVFGYFLYRMRNTHKFLVFAHLFFFIALGPALIRTGLGKSIFLSDRYVYLASFGLLFYIVAMLASLMARKSWDIKRQYAVFGIIALIYGALSFSYALKWDNAETLWGNTINKYPSVAYAYSNRGMYYKDKGELDKALTDFTSAIEIEDDQHALVNRGIIYRDQGRFAEALADYDRLLAAKPNDEYALNGKANVLFTMGRYQDAIDVYSTGIELHPRAVNFYANRSAAYYYTGQMQQALNDLNTATSISRNYPGLNQKKTVIYIALNDWTNAVESARLTAREDPNNHANYGDLGKALHELGRYQEAVDAYTQAINIYSAGKRYYQGRARAYDALGNSQAAQQDRQTARSL